MSHDHKNKRRDDNLKCHCNTDLSFAIGRSAEASGFVAMG